MKKFIRSTIVVFVIFLSSSEFSIGQNINWIKTQIDSIAKANNLYVCRIYSNQIISVAENGIRTRTEERIVSPQGSFKTEGNFLVTNNTYFNLDKLLFFKIKEDYIHFVFQYH